MAFHDITDKEIEDKNQDDQVDPTVAPARMQKGPAKNVILVGMTGAGKSSVGKALAKHIGLGFVDTDEEIERTAGKSISKIFSDDGEKAFRHLESIMIKSLKDIRNHVIAVGGGTLVDDRNWDNLRKIGLTIWLNCAPEDIANRLLKRHNGVSFRPLLADVFEEKDKERRKTMLIDKLSQLLSERTDRYSEANIEVRFGYVSSETCALNMIPLLRKKGVVRSHMGLTKHLFAVAKV